jgi:hypothetical protein
MNGPYFQKQSWSSFTYQGDAYDLTHLDEYEVEVADSQGTKRQIAVSFSDHCFTREPEAGDGIEVPAQHSPSRAFLLRALPAFPWPSAASGPCDAGKSMDHRGRKFCGYTDD